MDQKLNGAPARYTCTDSEQTGNRLKSYAKVMPNRHCLAVIHEHQIYNLDDTKPSPRVTTSET